MEVQVGSGPVTVIEKGSVPSRGEERDGVDDGGEEGRNWFHVKVGGRRAGGGGVNGGR